MAGSLGSTRIYAPYNDSGQRIGGHLTGSTLPFREAYCATPSDIPKIAEKIEKENLGIKMMRCIYLKVSLLRGPLLISTERNIDCRPAHSTRGFPISRQLHGRFA